LVPPALSLITDTSKRSDETFFKIVEQALSGGVDAILLREKALNSAKLLALASRLRVITRQFGARLIIHTQADIAAAIDADGVHLASHDMHHLNAARQWLNQANKTISISCHNADELALAHHLGADYAMLSPVFPTLSHPGETPLGLSAFQTLAAAATLPVVALGGISTENCNLLQGQAIAVIRAIIDADNPEHAAQCLIKKASIRTDQTGA